MSHLRQPCLDQRKRPEQGLTIGFGNVTDCLRDDRMNNGKLRIDDRLRQRREIDKDFATIGGVGRRSTRPRRSSVLSSDVMLAVLTRRRSAMTVEGKRAPGPVEDGQCLEGAGGQVRRLPRYVSIAASSTVAVLTSVAATSAADRLAP